MSARADQPEPVEPGAGAVDRRPARRCGSAAAPRARRSRTGSPRISGCAARRSGFPAPTCRRTAGCSGRCAPCRRAARCGSPSIRSSRKISSRRAVAMQGEPAGTRLVEPGQAVEDGRLAGAVRPDDRGDLAPVGGERQIVDRDQPAEAHRQMLDLEQRGAAACRTRSPRRAGGGRDAAAATARDATAARAAATP